MSNTAHVDPSDPFAGKIIHAESRFLRTRRVRKESVPRPGRMTVARGWVAAWLAVLMLGAMALLVWSSGAEMRVIRRLSPPLRAEMFREASADLARTCRPGPDAALADHCRDEIRFVSLFPECKADCISFLATFLPHPRR
jgi:hypothetical protein